MRYFAKSDVKQPEIVAALRKAGASVCITSKFGKGFPDLIAGYNGANYLIEVKSDKKVSHRSKGKLTPDQEDWHGAWRGQIAVVESAEEALALIADPPGRRTLPDPSSFDVPF